MMDIFVFLDYSTTAAQVAVSAIRIACVSIAALEAQLNQLILQDKFATRRTNLEQNTNKSLHFDAGGAIVRQCRDARPKRAALRFRKIPQNPPCPAKDRALPVKNRAADPPALTFLQQSVEERLPMSDENLPTPSKRVRTPLAQRVLASLVAGAGVDEISAAERLTRKRTENILREALRGRWIAPAEEFARLQITRLERMIAKLVDRLQKGDLEAIDRALKIVDRLDRYHGFTKARRLPERYDDEDRARLLKKLNEVANRLQPEQPTE
jgi:hypothetical protein